ncbi:MAG: S49 family peptidase, partial [Prochlorococcaceae cyanobacterium]
LYKDILSPDRALTEAERALLQELIDSSYGQFVAAVAAGRGLSPETVRAFADGRVFTGAQALELGLVDALGDEEAARRLAAELAGLDPERTRPVTIGRPRRPRLPLLPGGRLLGRLLQALELELAWAGQPLWLHRP